MKPFAELNYFGFTLLERSQLDRYNRAEQFLIIRAYSGEGWLEVDAEQYEVQHHKIYLLSPGTIHKLLSGKNRLKGFMLHFSIDFIRFGENEFDIDLFNLFTQLDKEPSIALSLQQDESLEKVLHLIREETAAATLNLIIIKSLLHVLLAKLMSYKQSPLLAPSLNKQRVLTFFNLLRMHFIEERNASFYADYLNISTKRLNQILQELTGKTALQLLHWMLVLEAKRFLILGKYSIKQIAHMLGFEDRAYFSHFFKRNTGLAPEYFREKFVKPIFAQQYGEEGKLS
ncbi:helix-turn-helix domain-containing protein [Pedobacter sp. AW31-3R]|uniref:AraC family transcriptional regulator n=1 Tax=Pedobacter sp. AW31-3R TaxID=3445781 RepID=UPI003F9F0406